MKFRRFWLLAAVVALVLAIILQFGRIGQLIHLLSTIRWYVLTLMLVVQGLSYLSNALFYRSVLRIFGYEVEIKRLYKAALVINFVNQIFPSGGISGASFLSQELSEDVPVGKAALAQLLRYVFTFVSFLIVLTFGFLLLFLAGNLSQVTARLILLLVLTIIVLCLLATVIISDRRRVENLGHTILNWVNGAYRKLFRKHRPLLRYEQLQHFFDEFYHGRELLTQNRQHWLKPLLYAFCGNLAELATVYVVFLAFGKVINPGIVIAAYTLANIVSLMSFFIGGVGVYEATMITTLVALGTPLTLSFSVVLVYRTLNFLLFLPLGFYYYRQVL